jgi:hypothetical protein
MSTDAVAAGPTTVTVELPPALADDPTLANDDLIVSLYAIAQVWAQTNRVTATSVVRFIMTLMKAAERYVVKDDDGEHKTNAVMTVIRLILSDRNLVKLDSDAERQDIIHIVDEWGEPLIKGLIEAVHDPMGTLGKLSKGFQQMSGCCLPAGQRKKK